MVIGNHFNNWEVIGGTIISRNLHWQYQGIGKVLFFTKSKCKSTGRVDFSSKPGDLGIFIGIVSISFSHQYSILIFTTKIQTEWADTKVLKEFKCTIFHNFRFLLFDLPKMKNFLHDVPFVQSFIVVSFVAISRQLVYLLFLHIFRQGGTYDLSQPTSCVTFDRRLSNNIRTVAFVVCRFHYNKRS
uniref:(northern house mosquito) hypothetical protein n=1 Tax=Culex pipiens TaxID=7175 RepID=A0A8D8B242_CULPI